LHSFKKTKDFIIYQNVAIQLRRNTHKDNNGFVMNQKSFETIHGIVGQSIRDKQCSAKYKKEDNDHLQKNNISFPYKNGKTKKNPSSNWNHNTKNKNNHDVQKEEYIQGNFNDYQVSGPFENDFKYGTINKKNHRKNNIKEEELLFFLYTDIINNNENDFLSKIQN